MERDHEHELLFSGDGSLNDSIAEEQRFRFVLLHFVVQQRLSAHCYHLPDAATRPLLFTSFARTFRFSVTTTIIFFFTLTSHYL
jgi:hypothetical protein